MKTPIPVIALNYLVIFISRYCGNKIGFISFTTFRTRRTLMLHTFSFQWRVLDLNQRSLDYEPNEIPNFSNPQRLTQRKNDNSGYFIPYDLK